MDSFENWLQDYQDEAERNKDMNIAGVIMVIKRKYLAFKAKAKAVEPLALVADRKGYEIAQITHRAPFPNTWEIILRPIGGPRNSWVGENWPDFDSYHDAEKAAREWLEKQEDK